MNDDEKIWSWSDEAEAVKKDVRKHVDRIEVSGGLESGPGTVYFNLRTVEKLEYCVEMSGAGFRIVGERFDSRDMNGGELHETPYGLLNGVSEGFRRSFAGELARKLCELETNESHIADST